MPIIVTTCSNRKRVAPVEALRASDLPKAPLNDLAREWAARVGAETNRTRIGDLYCGRAFSLSRKARSALKARLFVVSAGLATVAENENVPAYSLTVSPGSQDNILGRVVERDIDASFWWSRHCAASTMGRSLKEVIVESNGPVLVALPATYLQMVAHELFQLPDSDLSRVRLLHRCGANETDPRLTALSLGYDARLDGPDSPIPGTQSDFAQRALSHFVDHVIPGAESAAIEEHRAAVEKALTDWRTPVIPTRRRLSDDELKQKMREHWNEARGHTSHMLRLFRDQLGLACEQGRFKNLCAQVRAEMEPL